MKDLFEILHLLTVGGHTRPKIPDHRLLSIAFDLEDSHPHEGLKKEGGDKCLEFGCTKGIGNHDKNLPC